MLLVTIRRSKAHNLSVSSLPTGTVTFLFTDIEGSTRPLHELGEGYAEALAEHGRVLRAAFARHGGVEVDRQGTRSSSHSHARLRRSRRRRRRGRPRWPRD